MRHTALEAVLWAREQYGSCAPTALPLRAIADRYTSIEQVTSDLRRGGLESSNLIVAVDFTKSNEWTGKESNGGRSLHVIGERCGPR
jgi:E3 ubiquitin-protein ligase RGLG